MRLLLDTHTFLWFIADDPHLPTQARTLLESDAELLLSTASLWEIAIKVSIGKLSLGEPYETFIPHQLAHNQIEVLQISVSHLATVAKLPLHQRDPFDRLIIAQATIEALPLVGGDIAFDAYGIKRTWD
jgi:PIN domain nuclease of toxin-antitoxin system